MHGEETKVMYKGNDFTEFDAVYLRHSDEEVMYAEQLTEILNSAGVETHMGNDTFGIMTNKFYSMKILAENKLNIPNSVYTISPDAAVDMAKRLGYPVIMKTIRGGGGQGVMRATSESELKPVMDTMKAFEQEICLQEYLEHQGEDNRVIVIGDKVIGYRRSSSDEEEWRSNIGAGGERQKIEEEQELKEVAKKAAQSIGADICGCDIIEHEGEYYVLELNAAAFGLGEKINEITGEDIPLAMVEWLHEQALSTGESEG
ncbi:MAG: RimK family alpha-L-glutamate ligase [Candidatus Nanohaloarchaea archaeon]